MSNTLIILGDEFIVPEYIQAMCDEIFFIILPQANIIKEK
jgi:hypothetical protein